MGNLFTVTDVINRVQRLFGDESGVQLQQSDIINFINDAQREAVMQHENLLQKEDFIDSVVGQQVYPTFDDLFTINAVWFKTSATGSYYALRPMSKAQMDQYIDGWQGPDYGNGTPQVYTRSADAAQQVFFAPLNLPALTVFPTPDIALTDAFKVSYARYPAKVNGPGDYLSLPAYYLNYVVEFCLMRAYEMDEDWEASDRKAQILQSTLDFNNGRAGWFAHEVYPSISPTWDDYV